MMIKRIAVHTSYKIGLILFGAAIFSLVSFSPAQAQSGKTRLKNGKPKIQTAKIRITEYGYEPASLRLRRGVPARVAFLRTTDGTCAKEVVFADYGIRRELPLNKTVVVSFTPTRAGEFSFTCGMNMHRGKLIVR